MASLVASGGIEKTGKRDEAFRLTDAGRSALFILAGDCFDKGPENLRLLRILRLLMDQGACMHVLAGNHDVRTLLGMRSVNPLLRVTSNEHF
ncbi:MAG: metallophosphoesterase, partial [Gammaproteobacteria bacterium]